MLWAFVVIGVAFASKPGTPLDHLPAHIEQITAFGGRADISPDNQEIAFIGKSFGDVYVLSLKTRLIRCLTCQNPHSAFLRVMHLKTGDYLLVGPRRVDADDVPAGRSITSELWYLARKPGSKPVPLGVRIFEGLAVSKQSMRIAYAQGHNQDADIVPDSYYIYTAELDVSAGRPRIIKRRVVHSTRDYTCRLEPQDFYANDTKMTFACYHVEIGKEETSQVMGIDFTTGQMQNFTQLPGTFNEPEGIFPDGLYTCVESDRHARINGVLQGEQWQIDLYKMKLDGTGKNIERLTYFNEYTGYHAGNPVVSTDGKFMAFQMGVAADIGALTGAGEGLFIYWFDKKPKP